MNLEPFFQAGPAIQIHMIAAIGAFLLGAVVLWRRKGGQWHKFNGRVWVALMLVTSFSAFFIHEIRVWGDYSPIHILAVTTPIVLAYAIHAARRRDIRTHQKSMKLTYLGGMIIAGGFTFLPGRLSHEIFFGSAGWAGFGANPGVALALAIVFLAAVYIIRRSANQF